MQIHLRTHPECRCAHPARPAVASDATARRDADRPARL